MRFCLLSGELFKKELELMLLRSRSSGYFIFSSWSYRILRYVIQFNRFIMKLFFFISVICDFLISIESLETSDSLSKSRNYSFFDFCEPNVNISSLIEV